METEQIRAYKFASSKFSHIPKDGVKFVGEINNVRYYVIIPDFDYEYGQRMYVVIKNGEMTIEPLSEIFWELQPFLRCSD